MSYNHYKFLLDNYRQRTDGLFATDPGVVAVRKALHHSYQHETSRMRERHRQEMARQKRQQIENERQIKIKISELKKREREISKRYEHVKTRTTHRKDTHIKRNADYFPKISYGSPPRPEKVGHSLPNRNQRCTGPRYEYETYRIPKGKGKEKIVFLPSIDVSAPLNVSDHEDDLGKLDRQQETQFPLSLPVVPKCTKNNTEKLSQPAANAESAAVGRSLPMCECKLQKYLHDFSSLQSIQRLEYSFDRVLNKQPPRNPRASPIKPDFTHELLRYYKEREYFRLQPGVEDFSSPQKPDKYEMLLLDSLDSRPEQIRVDQVDPKDPRSTYDILAIEDESGGSDSQEEF